MGEFMHIKINKLSKHTGAEVFGVNLKSISDEDIIHELKKAFSNHSVLVLREQNLSPNEFYKSAKLFGKIFKQHNNKFALKENNLVHYISNKDKFEDGKIYIPGDGYHTDHSNDLNPPKATILHAKSLPSHGGDTQFVNMHLVYNQLPKDLNKILHNLNAIHVYQSSHSKRKLISLPKNLKNIKEVIHPLVRIHPENNKICLYINPIRIEKIIGFSDNDTLELLDKLMSYVYKKENQYRHKWLNGDFVIWDNRILMHKANGDYDMNEDRYLYRVMIQNEILKG